MRAASGRGGAATPPPRVVAFGGGHGLAASLAAWKRLTPHLTAVVTVADDGGSSGRIRRELPVLPPGDLRMALAALADDGERCTSLARLVQHRFGGAGELAGHSVGNLMLTGLAELHEGDMVRALDQLADLLGVRGRVLPMADVPLDLVARVRFPGHPEPATVHGQAAIAKTRGNVQEIVITPADPPVHAQVLDAIATADVVCLGPGSWYTSVLPHLLVPRLHEALVKSSARVVVVLNLVPQPGETEGFSPEEHLRVLQAHLNGVALHTVIADADSVVDRHGLLSAAQECGAGLVLAPVAVTDGSPRHDPERLSTALASAVRAR